MGSDTGDAMPSLSGKYRTRSGRIGDGGGRPPDVIRQKIVTERVLRIRGKKKRNTLPKVSEKRGLRKRYRNRRGDIPPQASGKGKPFRTSVRLSEKRGNVPVILWCSGEKEGGRGSKRMEKEKRAAES